MNIQLNNPTDVHEHVGKVFGCTATFSDIVNSCESELSTLYKKIEEIQSVIAQKQRECVVVLESLQRYEDSEELNRQRKQAQFNLADCKRKQDMLKKVLEEYRDLIMEYKSLSNDAEALVEKVKKPVKPVRDLITKFLNCV